MGGCIMTRKATEIRVYWDAQDVENQGWAYRLIDEQGDIDSGPLECVWCDIAEAIEDVIAISEIDIAVSDFAQEPYLEGGYAIWTASDAPHDIEIEARNLVARLRNYDECHDGDVDKAADIIELLLARLPSANYASQYEKTRTMRAFKVPMLVTIDDVAAVSEEYREADKGPVTLEELRDYLRGALRIDVDIENHINEVGWTSAEVMFGGLQELTDEEFARYYAE
jgi:hypothetical protein